jgi:predicted component of viral defense system (DUF524 family)
MAKFKQGNTGRPKGAVNKLHKTVKETVLNVFNSIQGDPKHNLEAFAKKHPKEFYLIASKLIPTEMIGTTETIIKVTSPDERKLEEQNIIRI